MRINTVTFTLKDGRTAKLVNPSAKYVDSTLEYLRKSAEETEFILRYPEECEKFTVEYEKRLFKNIVNDANSIMMLCVVDGVVAGNCSMQFNSHMKTKHRSVIAIALLKEFWGQGIGTKMFETMERFAEHVKGVSQLELEFVEGNTRAKALYEKMGFEIIGYKPNAIHLKDGTVLGEYMMVKQI